MIKSFLYGFFQYDMFEKVYILVIGKTEDKEERVRKYRTTNANISFSHLKEVGHNYLTEAEGNLKEYLRKYYPTWKTSTEQFVVGDSLDDVYKAEKILEEKLETVKTKGVDHKTVDYNRGTLPLNGSDYGVVDIRDFRKSCDMIPGKVSMIMRRAGAYESPRTYLTKYILKGRKLLKLDIPKRFNISNEAWDVVRIVQANERDEEKNGKKNFIKSVFSKAKNVLG